MQRSFRFVANCAAGSAYRCHDRSKPVVLANLSRGIYCFILEIRLEKGVFFSRASDERSVNRKTSKQCFAILLIRFSLIAYRKRCGEGGEKKKHKPSKICAEVQKCKIGFGAVQKLESNRDKKPLENRPEKSDYANVRGANRKRENLLQRNIKPCHEHAVERCKNVQILSI